MRWIWIFLLMPPSLVKTLLQILVITLPQGEGNYSLSQATLFRKSVSPNSRKEWKKIWFALSKLSQKIWRWLKALGYLYFVWSVFFQTWWLEPGRIRLKNRPTLKKILKGYIWYKSIQNLMLINICRASITLTWENYFISNNLQGGI